MIIKNLRPVTSVAMLRIAFRIMGPLLPRLANAHSLFNKVKFLAFPILLRDYNEGREATLASILSISV